MAEHCLKALEREFIVKQEKKKKSKIYSPLAWGGALRAVVRACLYSFRARPRIMKSCKSQERTIADSPLPYKSDLLSYIHSLPIPFAKISLIHMCSA